ncbi:acyltransferase [Sinomonas atrocyanea]|uniref:acyltransferase n=1 Tax=Sinomonas atrocyanea TaxID=37927 RepID=UPI003D9985B9
MIYRFLGVSVARANIYPHLRFMGRARVIIGDDVVINTRVTLDNAAMISIEAGAAVGPEVFIGTSTHELGTQDARAGALAFRPVVVGRGAWIGARTVILPGISIGSGAVIAAGAVVVRDCEPNTLYAGVPARPVRDLTVD